MLRDGSEEGLSTMEKDDAMKSKQGFAFVFGV
jgi:hypothetical protein